MTPRRGRPPFLVRARRMVIMLEENAIAKARELGAGNVSRGIRRALEGYLEPSPAPPPVPASEQSPVHPPPASRAR